MRKVNITPPEDTGNVNKTLQPVPRHLSNLEAEKGEIVFGDTNNDSMPETYTVGGQRHTSGGTPLNLPDASFVFSDTKDMKIYDPEILKEFGKTGNGKKGFTPATLAKGYDINIFRKQLESSDSDKAEVETAEAMITNYNLKLGKLAIIQESQKGFPTGIPKVAMPYLDKTSIDPASFVQGNEKQPSTAKYGTEIQFQVGGTVGEEYNKVVSQLEEAKNKGEKFWINHHKEQLNKLKAYAEKFGWDKTYQDKKYQDYESAINVIKQKNIEAKTTPVLPIKKEKVVTQPIVTTPEVVKRKVVVTPPSDNTTASDIKAYTGDKSNSSNKSAYSDKDWREFRDAYYPGVKSEKELQRAMITDTSHPEFAQIVSDLHAEFGPLKNNQNVDDGRLGHRWDAFLAKTKEKLATGVPEIKTKPAVIAAKSDFTQQPLSLRPDAPAPIWLQDKINALSAVSDYFGIKKHNPWNPVYSPRMPEVSFVDPTRELAANAEGMKIGTDALTTFGNPQAFAANFAQIQGTGAKNAADILARYNNTNIPIANQHNSEVANIANDAAVKNLALKKQGYDEQTIVNQQFDNARNMAKQNLRQSFVDVFTNRAQTQSLNSMFDNFQVDPNSGGLTYLTHGRELHDNGTDGSSASVETMLSHFKGLGYTNEEALDAVKLSMGQPTKNNQGLYGGKYNAYNDQYGYPIDNQELKGYIPTRRTQ